MDRSIQSSKMLKFIQLETFLVPSYLSGFWLRVVKSEYLHTMIAYLYDDEAGMCFLPEKQPVSVKRAHHSTFGVTNLMGLIAQPNNPSTFLTH